jgi:hypothetical protein
MAKVLNFFDVGARWKHRNLGIKVFIRSVTDEDPPRFRLREEKDPEDEDDDPTGWRFTGTYTAEEVFREFDPFPGKSDRWGWLLQGGALAR